MVRIAERAGGAHVGWLMVPDAGHGVVADRADLVVPMLDVFLGGAWPEGLNR